MATTNDITGDRLVSKPSKQYKDNYDAIFRKPAKDKKSESKTTSTS